MPDPFSPDLLDKTPAYWRAAYYPSVGQIYLKDNPLLDTPLNLKDIRPRLLWGTTTGLSGGRRRHAPFDMVVLNNLGR